MSIEATRARVLDELLDDTGLLEQTLGVQTVYAGDFLQVQQAHVRLPNGALAQREYLNHPGAVMIMPVFDNGEVLLVRQYRYPVQQVVLEFPAGKKDAGESPIDTAQRELLEETGYRAGRLTHVTDIYNALGYCDEVIHLYAAHDLVHMGAQQLDEHEFVQLLRVSLDELMDWVRRGWVPDVKTQLGVFWLLDARMKGN